MIDELFKKRSTITVPCTIEVENTFESLHAHVSLHGAPPVDAGDEVLVHGEPVRVPYGHKATFTRDATVTRASGLERLLTKIAAKLELTELYEVSFSSGRKL